MKKSKFWGFLEVTLVVLVMFSVSACGGGMGPPPPPPPIVVINVSKSVQLTEEAWKAILREIGAMGEDEYVNLDLSLCTRSNVNTGGGLRSDGTFNPMHTISDAGNGKEKIKSLILPNAATSIVAEGVGLGEYPPFSDLNLYSVSGSAVTDIGSGAFDFQGNLSIVNFPQAVNIGDRAFWECISLVSVSFPQATSIGGGAFYKCRNLTNVNLPKLTSMGNASFGYLIGYTGYQGNINLTINLGPNAPTIGIESLKVNSGTVTVKVPSGASGYGTIPQTYSGNNTTANWGNGFRGGGWNGSQFQSDGGTSTINTDITLRVQYQ
jgi:hypothetical protein